MKTFLTLLIIVLSFNTYSQQVKISQVYGGGGDLGAAYNQDFIEIFNSGYSSVNISGWSVQYASATGSTWSAVVIPASTILPGGTYYLIGLASGANGNALPTPDATGSFDISNTEGKVTLVNTSTLLSGASACSDPSVKDLVGYGATASCYLTAPVSTTSIDNTKSCGRFYSPCMNTGNNSSDFIVSTVSPKNTASGVMHCTPPPDIEVNAGSGDINVWAVVGTYYETEYLIMAMNLDDYPGNITITASAGIEVSLTAGTGFASSINLPYTTPSFDAIIHVRVNVLVAGPVTGSITHTGGGANAVKIVSGMVLDLQPTIQTSNIVLSNFTDRGMDISLTNGNGTSRLVTIRETAVTGQGYPSNGHVYSANPAIALAGQMDINNPGNLVVYSGSGSGPITISGLIPGTNYTITAYEFNGSNGSNNYNINYSTNYASGNTTGSGSVLLQRNFSSYSCPLYMASGNNNKIPTMFQATVTGLSPNTTYRWYTQAAIETDIMNYNTGEGDPILIDYTLSPVTYTYCNTPSITTAGCYGKFTTNNSGSFSGFFGFVHNADSRFTAGDSILPSIAIAADGATTIEHRYALTTGIKILQFESNSNPDDGTFIKGKSYAQPGNILFLYDTWIGAYGRPLSGTLVEGSSTISNSGTAIWGNNFISGYDQTAGSWNTIIPNINANGVQLIQATNPALSFQASGVCNRDGDGIWPTGSVITVNPAGGVNPLQVSATDAPLTGGSCFIIIPVKMVSFEVQKINNTVKLNWITAQEINSKEFIVERSGNGTNWSAIVTVHAAGNSSTKMSYTTTDNAPLKGINFYRIREVDIDGKFDYSETKSILFNAAYKVLITPNPASSLVNIYVDKNNNSSMNIQILDASGKIMSNINTALSHVQINTARFSRGLYYVKIIDEKNIVTSKLLLQ